MPFKHRYACQVEQYLDTKLEARDDESILPINICLRGYGAVQEVHGKDGVSICINKKH